MPKPKQQLVFLFGRKPAIDHIHLLVKRRRQICLTPSHCHQFVQRGLIQMPKVSRHLFQSLQFFRIDLVI